MALVLASLLPGRLSKPVCVRENMAVKRTVCVMSLVLVAAACGSSGRHKTTKPTGSVKPNGTTAASNSSATTTTIHDNQGSLPPGSSSTTRSDSGSSTSRSASTTRSTQPNPNETTIAPQLLLDTYRNAFNAECNKIWSFSPNRILVDGDYPTDVFTVNECVKQRQNYSDSQFFDLADARKQGHDDAINKAELLAYRNWLCWTNAAKTAFVGCWNSHRPDQASPPIPFPTG